jgi:glycosyltransferase involved in cell wall biosynthesis
MRTVDQLDVAFHAAQDEAMPASESLDISVVIPVTERCQDLLEIINDTSKEIQQLSLSYEFLVVFDVKFAIDFEALRLRCGNQEHIRSVRFNGNFGESAALRAGFELAKGRWIVTLASYPQVTSSQFSKAYQALVSGADMVVTRREPRTDPVINRLQTYLFHKLIGCLTGSPFKDMACGFKMFTRNVAGELDLYGDFHRFLPSLALHRGFKVLEIPAAQHPKNGSIRFYGLSTYIHRLVEILNLFFLAKFAKRPLRLFGGVGLLLTAVGGGVTVTLSTQRLLGLTSLADRPLFLLGVMLFSLGVQVILLGLIGEIIVFTHARDIKDYRIDEIHN